MSDVTLVSGLHRSIVERIGSALVDLKSAAVLPPQQPSPHEPDAEVWVDPAAGDDANTGHDERSAFRSLSRASEALKPRSRLMLAPGQYHEGLKLKDLGTSADRPIWVKSVAPGQATLSNAAKDLAQGRADWKHVDGGLYSTPFPVRPWAGFAGGRFLFSYKSLRDLKAAAVDGFRKPRYGLAYQEGRLFLRMPGGADPNGQPVMVTKDYAAPTVTIRRSPHVILDGIAVTGAGNSYAIDADEQSHHLWMQNVVGDLSRVLVRLPSDSMVRWCQYGYRGLMPWAEEVMSINYSSRAPFGLFKKYNVYAGGNAHYEGRIATSFDQPSRRCRFEHNLIGPCGDGSCLGRFSDSSSYRDVIIFAIDDGFEKESHLRSHDSAELSVTEALVINAFGSAFSHQDTAKQIRGPHRIERSIAFSPHPFAHAAFVIKNMDLQFDPRIEYDRCLLHAQAGPTGWGSDVNFMFLDHKRHRTPNLSIRNTVLWADPHITDWDKEWTPDCDHNVVVADRPYPELQGPNGMWFSSIDALKLRGPTAEGMDFRPLPGSPLIGAGENGVTIGPYDLGEPLKHRPMTTAFTNEMPSIWPVAA